MANNLSFSIEFDKEQKIYIIKAKTFLIQDGFCLIYLREKWQMGNTRFAVVLYKPILIYVFF